MILALDISTSITGFCIFNKWDCVHIGHIDLRKEKDFFKKEFQNLELIKLKHLDSMGLVLYYLNKIFFSKETFPSSLKIFLWDKIFTPLTIVIDFITNYRFGKCLVVIYKKNRLF